jgi:hypothetical protein
VKEWIKVTKPVRGPAVVTVTLSDENLTAKWSTVAFSRVREGVVEARSKATGLLQELREAVSE